MQRIFLVVILLYSYQASAIVRFAIQGGITSMNASVDPPITTNARGGLALGAGFEVGLATHWNLQIEGLYLHKGYIVPASSTVGETTVRIDYFELPLFLKYSFSLLLIRPFFMAGGYLGFKTKADYVFNNTDTELKNIRSNDLGLIVGGGMELAFSPLTSLFASVRYDLGLYNILDATAGGTKSKGVIILGGFLFGI